MSNRSTKSCRQPYLSADKSRIFKCADHADNISKKFRSFFENKEFFDIVLVAGVDKAEFQAHRLVLSASSDFFLGMFRSNVQETKTDRVELKEIDGITMRKIIHFIYTGEIELDCETTGSVLVAADFLQMKTLIDACCAFIGEQIEVSNCLGIALFAERYRCDMLYRKSYSYAFIHFDKVRTEQEFTQLNEEQLIDYISSDDLLTCSEEEVFQSVVEWVEYDKKNREKCIFNLLSHIRFPFLQPTFITTIESSYSLCKTEDCVQLIHSWLQWHLSPENCSQFSTHSTTPRVENQKLVVVSGPTTRYLIIHTLNRRLNIWTNEEVPIKLRRTYCAVIVINKKLILAGGFIDGGLTNRVDCLDLKTKERTNLPHMRSVRSYATMAELNGDLYVLGGSGGAGTLNSMEKYSFSTGQWEEMAPLSSPCVQIKVAVGDGIIYTANNNSHAVEYYDPATNKWTLTAEKNEKSKSFGIGAVGGYLYAIGGHDEDQKITQTVERYHRPTDTWSFVSPIKAKRNYGICVVLNNRLVSFGGINRNCFAEEYNPETDEWTSLASLPYSCRTLFKVLTM